MIKTYRGSKRKKIMIELGKIMSRGEFSKEAISAALLAENHDKCHPPLAEAQVLQIANFVVGDSSKPLSSSIYNGDDENHGVSFEPIPFSKILESAVDVEWLVDKIIPMGTSVVLGGAPGVGKSWLLEELAISVATGTLWLDKFDTKQGRVLVIDSENSFSLIRDRGLKILRGRGLSEIGDLDIEFLVSSGMNLSDKNHVIGLEELLEERRPALVLIDSLVRVHRASENSATEMAAVFGEIKRLVENFGCVFLFTHHNRKLGLHNDPSQRLRGSSEIMAFVDSFLSIEKVSGVLRIQHSKARFDEPMPDFLVEIKEPSDKSDAISVKYSGVATAESKAQCLVAQEFTLDLIKEKSLKRKEILKRGKTKNLSQTTIDRAINDLVETKQVDRTKKGREVVLSLKEQSSSSSLYINDDNNCGK